MNKKMFCFQCEQTAGCTGCTGNAGVCGKKADTAKLQDELTGALIGLARAIDGTAAVFRLQGKCDTTLRGSARCHPPCRYPESSSGWCSLQLSECLPDGAGSMRLRSHSVMHHIFLKAHPIPGSAPEIFHFR